MYNAELYIQETINSVVEQSYENWEMIIVDNNSSDLSKEIVKQQNNPNIRLIEMTTNSGGPAHPRNVGIEHAKGEYLAFLDADDLWSESKLEEQLDFMITHDLNFSSTNKSKFNLQGIIKEGLLSKIKNNFLKNRVSIKTLFMFNSIYTSSVMIKITDRPIAFDTLKELIAVEDLYLWLSLLEAGYSYQYIDKKLLKYRIVNTSASNHSNKRIVRLRHLFAINKFILAYKRYDLYPIYVLRSITRTFV